MKTFLKRLSGILLVLAGLLLIFHGIENWRGARALARWEVTSKALGQPLSLEELARNYLNESSLLGFTLDDAIDELKHIQSTGAQSTLGNPQADKEL